MSQLAKYTKKAKKMSDGELHYALLDIKKTLELHKENTPYAAKLFAEFDAYTTEKYKRHNRRVK